MELGVGRVADLLAGSQARWRICWPSFVDRCKTWIVYALCSWPESKYDHYSFQVNFFQFFIMIKCDVFVINPVHEFLSIL